MNFLVAICNTGEHWYQMKNIIPNHYIVMTSRNKIFWEEGRITSIQNKFPNNVILKKKLIQFSTLQKTFHSISLSSMIHYRKICMMKKIFYHGECPSEFFLFRISNVWVTLWTHQIVQEYVLSFLRVSA